MKLIRYGQEIGCLEGRYRLQAILGSGGMADVCRAYDEREKRFVAIKLVKADEIEADSLNRFITEAYAAKRLYDVASANMRNQNILRVYDIRIHMLTINNQLKIPLHYLVMEYARGGDLHHRMEKGRSYPLDRTLSIFAQICRVVDYAHCEHNLIHRDIKPLNILFRILPDQTEIAVLSDFGLAVQANATHFTLAGAGTLAYMPPEQIYGHPEKASDIFALGVLLYQLCTGYLPFIRNLANMHRPLPIPTPISQLNPKLPRALDNVLLRALANNPADRPATVATLWQEVYAAIATDPRLLSLLPERSTTTNESLSPTQLTNQTSARSHRITRPTKAVTNPILTNTNNNDIPPLALHQSGTPDNRHPRPQQQPPTRDRRISTKQFDQPLPTVTPKPIPRITHNLPKSQPASSPAIAVTSIPRIGKQASSTPNNNTDNTLTINRGRTDPIPKVTFTSTIASGPCPPKNPLVPSHFKHYCWLPIILVTTLSVVILVLLSSLVFANSNDISQLFSPSISTTITITPDRVTQTDTHTFQGLVTGTPNANARQITIRQLTATKTNQKQINVTGKRNIPAKQATGTLTFRNNSVYPKIIDSAIAQFKVNGVTVVLDHSVTIPAADPSAGTFGIAQASAHATEAGPQGNLPANSISGSCSTDGSIIVSSSAFTGGQAKEHYTYLQQSDVDKAFNEADRSSLQKATQSNLNQQVHSNEHRLPETSSCNPVKTTSSIAVNARITATTAIVTISEICQETVFDYQSTLQISQKALKSKAMKQLDHNYTLQGDVTISKVTPGTNPIFTVTAQGTWVYNWTEAAKQELLRQLAGKTQAQAQDLLKTYRGVAQATITLENRVKTVPTNPKQISLTVLRL